MKPIRFFLNFEPNPPTVTHQEKKVRVVNGKPIYYDPSRLKDARALLFAKIKKFAPEKPWNCPIQFCIRWMFRIPDSRSHRNDLMREQWKTTKPDTDNLNKMIKDVMTECGFWKDDSFVCRELIEKKEYSSDMKHGILISIIDLQETSEGDK